MPNIAAVLKDEISRLSRREIRKQVQPIRKASATYRHDIAALKRQVQELRQQAARRPAPAATAPAADAASGPPMRFVAKGLRSLRKRLGVSAHELALLIGVSDQSIYNWELKKTTPRKDQLKTLASIRELGKRDARQRLDAMGHKKGKPGRKAKSAAGPQAKPKSAAKRTRRAKSAAKAGRKATAGK